LGLKSISALAVAIVLVTIAAARGTLAVAYLGSVSSAAWFLIGMTASLACALIGVGWRFGVKSKGAVALVAGRPTLVDDAAGARELPGGVQRALVLVGLIALALGALDNRAAARIVEVPETLTEPSPSEYCVHDFELPDLRPQTRTTEREARAPQAGCALVRRAVELGYAKSLGSCAPRPQISPSPSLAGKSATCTRRQLDEPYLHYAYRRLASAFAALGSTTPSAHLVHRSDEVRGRLEHAGDLLADVRHAITGSPHASHHLWLALPDPHPITLAERFTGIPRCSTRFADLPLWPTDLDRSAPSFGGAAVPALDRAQLVEHVLGQLLFASRFGDTASCDDYVFHWGARGDACAQLVADPEGFLTREGALASVRAVLDRRRRKLAILELRPRPEAHAPPPVSAVVSLQCLSVDVAGRPSASSVMIDGEQIAVRELHVAEIRTDADGPIDVYLALAALLAGTDVPGVAAPRTLDTTHFPLVHMEELVDASPFTGARWPFADPALVAVYPFEHHLRAFIDAFRRRYLPQRSRL
jgi:hypothetical protein